MYISAVHFCSRMATLLSKFRIDFSDIMVLEEILTLNQEGKSKLLGQLSYVNF